MFSENDPQRVPPADLTADAHADGLNTTLPNNRLGAFVQLLNEHLRTTEQVWGFAREVRWRLRTLNYKAIKGLFKDLDQSTQQYVMFLQTRVQSLGGSLNQDTLPTFQQTDAEHASGFRECFREIHQCAEHLNTLVERTQRFMDGAVDAGDYATANLASEVLYRANQLICKIRMDIPSGASFTSECRQPSRPHTWFSTLEVWAHSPGLNGINPIAGYRF